MTTISKEKSDAFFEKVTELSNEIHEAEHIPPTRCPKCQQGMMTYMVGDGPLRGQTFQGCVDCGTTDTPRVKLGKRNRENPSTP